MLGWGRGGGNNRLVATKVGKLESKVKNRWYSSLCLTLDVDLTIGLPLEQQYRAARLESVSPAQTALQAAKNTNLFTQVWNMLTAWDSTRILAFSNPGDIGQVSQARTPPPVPAQPL